MTEALVVLLGYAAGAIPFGYLVGKARGVDIRAAGSGGTGATNALRILGPGAGAFVFALDVLKGLAPTLLANQLQLGELIALSAGIAAVLGHAFSPFLGFKGGKGIATGLGMLLGALPDVGLVCFGVFFLVMAASATVSLSSILAALAVIPLCYATHREWPVIAIIGAVAAFVVYLHRSNLQRIAAGKEPVFGQKPGAQRPNTMRMRAISLALAALMLAAGASIAA